MPCHLNSSWYYYYSTTITGCGCFVDQVFRQSRATKSGREILISTCAPLSVYQSQYVYWHWIKHDWLDRLGRRMKMALLWRPRRKCSRLLPRNCQTVRDSRIPSTLSVIQHGDSDTYRPTSHVEGAPLAAQELGEGKELPKIAGVKLS